MVFVLFIFGLLGRMVNVRDGVRRELFRVWVFQC